MPKMPKRQSSAREPSLRPGTEVPPKTLEAHTPDAWPSSLSIAVDEIFGDTMLIESVRIKNAENAVLRYYEQQLPAEVVESSNLAEAVPLQVQEAFERWKSETSSA